MRWAEIAGGQVASEHDTISAEASAFRLAEVLNLIGQALTKKG